jgi:hypothetical protein
MSRKTKATYQQHRAAARHLIRAREAAMAAMAELNPNDERIGRVPKAEQGAIAAIQKAIDHARRVLEERMLKDHGPEPSGWNYWHKEGKS